MIIDPFYIFDLMDILNGKASYDEEENFLQTYIYPRTEDCFPYIKDAADKGYAGAYESLGDCYAQGIGCAEDWKQAFYYWNLSVKNDFYGYAKIGDCYRLGKGTEKNYDKAWEAYESSLPHPDDFQLIEIPSVKELLLLKFDETHKIETEWLKYASEKAKNIRAGICKDIAYAYFDEKSEEFFYWIKRAADSGDLDAKCTMYHRVTDDDTKQKLLQEIFGARMNKKSRDSVCDLSKELIDDPEYEKSAFRILYDKQYGDFDWLCDHYQQQNREEAPEVMESEIDAEEDDDSYEEIPEGCFRCECCNCIISRDDQDEPDAQGNYCNNCYYSGDCLRTVYDDCPGEDE